MAKKIAICLDGTWNKEGQTDEGVETRTNALKLYAALNQDANQIALYHVGVGTKASEKMAGGTFGWGLFNQIKDAYRALVQNFIPGDSIFIFSIFRKHARSSSVKSRQSATLSGVSSACA